MIKNDKNYDIFKSKESKSLMLRKFEYIIFLDSLFDDNITMTYFWSLHLSFYLHDKRNIIISKVHYEFTFLLEFIHKFLLKCIITCIIRIFIMLMLNMVLHFKLMYNLKIRRLNNNPNSSPNCVFTFQTCHFDWTIHSL